MDDANVPAEAYNRRMSTSDFQRVFSDPVETIARLWRKQVVSSDAWKPTGNPGAAEGEAQGYYVTCGPLNAYAKPSTIDTAPNVTPRAAHEKIASDLAFDLNLPIPPAILHQWNDPPPVGSQRFVVLCLIPFLAAHKWRIVKAIPELETQLKQEMLSAASALVPFDTWLDNRDRLNDGNLLVSKADAQSAGPVGCAYIDYSYSMLYGWRQAEYKNVTPVGIYPIDLNAADKIAMGKLVRAIEDLSEQAVQNVVERVPDDFLSQHDRTLIIDGLLYRKSRVREALTQTYGELQ